jgi:inositol transporter-like SP family MFS transporter
MTRTAGGGAPELSLTGDGAPARQQWKWSLTAALAGYMDAGSIVAGSVGLTLWSRNFGLSPSAVGLLGAFGPNAISAGVGALLGGWICDKYGRKKIYAYDLLVYMFGVLWIIFAANTAMLIVGYVITGLAVGADIPASWSLITELAPADRRGRLGGLAQVWNLGPVVTGLLGLALLPLGMLGIRLLFGHLLLVALVTWILRHGVGESGRWAEAQARAKREAQVAGAPPAAGGVGPRGFARDMRELLSRRSLRLVLLLVGIYGVWNLFAGTNGFYQPYLLKSFGDAGEAGSVGLQALYFGLTVLATCLVFLPLSDRVSRRALFAVGAVIQFVGMALLVFLPLSGGVALAYIVLTGVGAGFGAQHFFQLWSGEVFPTRLRSTAQGLLFAIVRIGLGLWSFFVPVVTATGFKPLAVILSAFLLISGVLGVCFAPDTRGRSLEEIEERYGWSGPESPAGAAQGPLESPAERQG